MPVTIQHSLTATTPDDPAYEIRPSHWNSNHVGTLLAAGSEIVGAFSNAGNVSFGLDGGGFITATANAAGAGDGFNRISAGTQIAGTNNTISFADSNGISFGLSNSSVMTASYTVPSTAGLISRINVSGGTTSNNLSAVTFADSNGISFGLNASTITASHNGLTSQSNQNVTAGNGGFAFQTLSFSNANGISFGTSAGSAITGSYTVPTVTDYFSRTNTTFNGANISGSMTLNTNGLQLSMSVAAPGGGAFSAGVSTGGNTSGDTGVTGTRLVFAGGNNVTLSQGTDANGATITISGANAGGAQTGISGIVASDTTYTSGTVSFSNQNGVTIGSSVNGATQYIRLSVANQSTQPVAVSAANGSYAFSTLSFSNANGISFGTSAGSAVTASYTVPTQTNQTLGIYNSSQTTGASSSSTYDARSLSIVYSGNISGGWTNGSLLMNVTTAAQTNQTVGFYGSSQTTGSASSGTLDARSISVIGAGGISVGMHSTSAGGTTTGFLISGPALATTISGITSANVVGTNKRYAAEDHQHVGVYSVGVSNIGNTSGDTAVRPGQIVFVGGNNVTLSMATAAGSLQTITISAGAGGGVNPAASASNGSFNFTTLNFSNANNVTFGTSAGGIITASVAAPGAAAENNWFNLLGANTAGNTTASGSTIGLSGINLTLSGTNGSAINISAPATSSLVGFRGNTISSNGSTISVGPEFCSYFDNMNGEWPNSTTMQMLLSTSHVQPFSIDAPISFGFIRIPMSLSNAPSSTGITTGNSSWSYGHSRSHNFVLYSRGVGASSLSLQSIASTQLTDQQSIRISANANSTQFSYTNRATYQMSTGPVDYTYDYSSSAASLNFHTSGMTAATGLKMMEFPWATTLAPGNYWLMYGVSSSTVSQYTAQGTRLFNIMSNYGMSQPNLQFGTIGAATNNSIGPYYGLGSFTTAGGGTTASLPISAITTSGSHNKMFFAIARIA